jgi:hypothetical protein
MPLDAINLEAETREQNGGYMSEENKPIEKDAEKKKPEELTIDELKAVAGGEITIMKVVDKVSP